VGDEDRSGALKRASVRIQLAVLGLAAGLAPGCGAPVGHGQATLWVTRDRGAHVLLVARVPAGLTAMQALERKAKVKTRYGGRFVQAINGLEGSLDNQRDWFYFVNGYEADRGGAEYRLHPGDVEWWDYRPWKSARIVPVVVGAFPEPFLHGYDGKKRRAFVYAPGGEGAKPIARMLHASVLRAGTAPKDANVLFLVPGPGTRFQARLRDGASAAGAPVELVFDGNWRDLLSRRFRFRYEVSP
jgi:Domain of unknown function (DUF4430)